METIPFDKQSISLKNLADIFDWGYETHPLPSYTPKTLFWVKK